MKLLLQIPIFVFASIFMVIFSYTGSTQEASPAGSTESSLKISAIHNITVLAHPVCSFQLLKEKNPDHYVFAEGDICPVGGDPCHYHAIMNINGSDVALSKVDLESESEHAVFKSADLEVRIDYIMTQCTPKQRQCVPTIEQATLTIMQGQNKKQLKVKGYCGD